MLVALTSSAERSVTKVAPPHQDNDAPIAGLAYKPKTNRPIVSLLSQEKSEAAQRVETTSETKAVKPKVFHGDVRRLPLRKPVVEEERPEPQEPSAELPIVLQSKIQSDLALQTFAPAAPAPTPNSSFPGLDFATWGAGWPPDTNGDVGPNHYIQTVNTSIGIYDKSNGTRLAAFTFDGLFSQAPTGTPCDNSNQGDPVALYDALSDRWIVTDFAWSNYTSGAMYQCMAVSQTSDPVLGGWYFYAWQTASGGKIPDYPKLGVWPDGIYMSANIFNTTGSQAFQNAQVWAFNRTEMESGVTAHVVSFTLPQKISGTTIFGLLPSNLRTNGSAPSAGAPNYFASIFGSFVARVWKFHVDYGVPANSTFTGPSNVTISSFSAGPGSVPEKSGNNVDTLSYRLMMQNQYQNANGLESLWITHTVGNGGSPNVAQLRWYQLNVTGGTVVTAGPVQQGTWAPDSKNRFMPSLALNKNGDMALGYSVSDLTMFPAIRYAGRLASDPFGTLGQGETSLIEGTGFQCCKFSDGTTNTRWGDYSTMTIDPDGCTFWYTNEYYDSSPVTLAQDNWKTRIGSFKFTACTPNPVGTLQGTVTDAGTGNPISAALVTAGIYKLKTNGSGFYQFANTPTGTYTVNVTASGYTSGSANNVNVSNGGTTTQNFALSAPLITTSLAVGAASGAYGGTTTLTATLTQQGGSALSGKTITFTLNGASFAGNTAVTNGSGIATLSNVSLAGINAGAYPTGVGASFAAGGGFAGSSGTNSLTISKATPVITWNNPANITYGVALSGTQLNASTPVAGSFVYTPAAGTVLHFGNSQNLSTTFTPTDTTNYNGASKSVSINVQKAALTATAQDKSKTYRATNPTLTYAITGFVNSDTQGSATTGQPTLSTTAVTNSIVGGYPITIVVGTLTATDYTFSFVNGTLTVSKATPVINWSNPADIVYGTSLGATQLNASASNPNDSSSVAGSFSYNPTSGTVLNAGNSQALATTFTPTDTSNYNGAAAGVFINVLKATPAISWSDPAPITQGTPLSATQLNATTTVAGTLSYNPASGTVLPVGNGQALNTLFTPTDTVNYNNNNATVHIDVLPNSPSDILWVEDTTPVGAGLSGSGEGWNWISANPAPYSGTLASQSNLVSGLHQHYFDGATETLTVNARDVLIAYVYLDPVNPPTEIMLQWNDGSWSHRAYWGANNIAVGDDGTDGRRFIGSLPPTGQWVRLEVPANLVGLEGHVLNGMAFTLYDGRATWDHAGKSLSGTPTPTPTPPGDGIWVEDTTPAGAGLNGTGEGWNWIGANPAPYSGTLASQSNLVSGLHQHYFEGATETLTVNAGDVLIAYVYLDPVNPPTEIMLQWNDGSWSHRAYWGANNIALGADGTNSQRFIGGLPAGGQWVRLEVPAILIGLEGQVLNGMAFTLYDGRATWDHAGKSSTGGPTPTPTPTPPAGIWVEDTTPAGAGLNGSGEGWNWIGANPVPYSGTLASQSNLVSGLHQHYFEGATETLTVNAGDVLIAYVYLDPVNPPTEIMLQWNDGSWSHRAYWGANNIALGDDGTNGHRLIGSLPATGQWVRLEVPASLVGLEGSVLNGLAFTLYDGRATWDHAGKAVP
jgi:hypothetical protein